ncbi:MAG: hypothetical protein PVJ43_13850 [Gemmatimonadales bacterium]|jgi:uncharacterized integral membrane protein
MKKNALLFRILGGVVAVVALGWFAYVNGGQTVDLHLGLFTLRGVSFPVVIYASVIAGMLLVVGVSARADLRAQKALKRYDQIAADALKDFDADDERSTAKAERKP